MMPKNAYKLFQAGILTFATVIGYCQICRAADNPIESAQPASTQPQQQATPSQTPVEPEADDDEETALV